MAQLKSQSANNEKSSDNDEYMCYECGQNTSEWCPLLNEDGSESPFVTCSECQHLFTCPDCLQLYVFDDGPEQCPACNLNSKESNDREVFAREHLSTTDKILKYFLESSSSEKDENWYKKSFPNAFEEFLCDVLAKAYQSSDFEVCGKRGGRIGDYGGDIVSYNHGILVSCKYGKKTSHNINLCIRELFGAIYLYNNGVVEGGILDGMMALQVHTEMNEKELKINEVHDLWTEEEKKKYINTPMITNGIIAVNFKHKMTPCQQRMIEIYKKEGVTIMIMDYNLIHKLCTGLKVTAQDLLISIE